MKANSNKQVALIIVVAALGYFVDIYDLVLFGVVKSESLDQIMVGADALSKANTGKFLFNMQMLGMLIGGLLWGILGDKKGRLKVLFGSILLYSVANLANAFVTDDSIGKASISLAISSLNAISSILIYLFYTIE
jgi:MFS family permease